MDFAVLENSLYEFERKWDLNLQAAINHQILDILIELAGQQKRIEKKEQPLDLDKFATVEEFSLWLPFCKRSTVYKMLESFEEDENNAQYMQRKGNIWKVHPKNLLNKIASQQCQFPMVSSRAMKYLNNHPYLRN